MEFWVEIKGYEGVYCVSSKGKVKHLASIHKTKIRGTECQRKTKVKKGNFVHHKDGNKENNSIENLNITGENRRGIKDCTREINIRGEKTMDIKKGDEASEFRLTDEERQPCEIWTRLWYHGILQTRFRI